MKISGFTIIRNAVANDYPVVEAITSILPVVDEMIVSVGDSEDATEALIRAIPSKRSGSCSRPGTRPFDPEAPSWLQKQTKLSGTLRPTATGPSTFKPTRSCTKNITRRSGQLPKNMCVTQEWKACCSITCIFMGLTIMSGTVGAGTTRKSALSAMTEESRPTKMPRAFANRAGEFRQNR